MNILIWHWGRRGAGPLVAARLAAALRELPGYSVRLSLAAGAEILSGPDAPECDWREPTYETSLGFIRQRLAGPFVARRVGRQLKNAGPDVAICAMPALLDGRMVAALQRAKIPYGVIVHDANAHPGDMLSFRLLGQRRMLRGARWLFSLTHHVEAGLLRQGFGRNGQSVEKLWLPAIGFGGGSSAPREAGRPRFLYFGRLLPYKGLDLLADALAILRPERPFELRVCGEGPNSRTLEKLRAQPGVALEQRWFADSELPELLAWADALVLPYREASQSGVAALAIAAGKHVLSTNVGGLPEQLGGVPQALLCNPTAVEIAKGLLELTARLGRAAPPEPRDSAQDWREMAQAMTEILIRQP